MDAIDNRDTRVLDCGTMSTSPSVDNFASASETGERDKPNRSQMSDLRMIAPGGKSNAMIADLTAQ